MSAQEIQQLANPAVFADVLDYLNRREFPRIGVSASTPDTLYAVHDRICAHYASLQLDSLFQPLFDFRRRRIIGHEALLASSSGDAFTMVGNVLSPERVFTLAANEDITFVDRLARTLHALNYLLQSAEGVLHLNVHPHHLLSVSADHGRVFEGILKNCGLETRRIVLEIPEYAVAEKKKVSAAIAAWKEKGYGIAIDNFGREHAQIGRVKKLQPDYIKLDRELLLRAQRDVRIQRNLAKSVQEAQQAGIAVIGAGIETGQQLDLLRTLDVGIAQGFLFGRPQPYCLSAG
ncbi:MAG TPA: EAL domain-containing protein [Pseudomonadales bacterium]|nr:EAL domain-containing protein [Pseudomonadales bacterium]